MLAMVPRYMLIASLDTPHPEGILHMPDPLITSLAM